MYRSSVSPSFITALPPWATGTVSNFATGSTTSLRAPTSRRAPCISHARAARVNWTAVAGSQPPNPSSDDENEQKNENEDTSESLFSSSGESVPSPLSGRSDDGSRDSEFDLDVSAVDGEINELFKFVKSIPPPELVQRFTQSAPPMVQKAIRETLISMLGSLPPLAFKTNVSTMSPNLVQLFHSSLVTGYMFRNAAYRLELTRTLDWSGLKALPATTEEPEIKGGVAIFKQPDGSAIEVPVDEYITELRQTVDNLRGELTRERKGGNELLNFIATMDQENIESLTKDAGDEVVDAMKKVVDFVTKTQGLDPSVNSVVEATAPELGQLLFYLMVSGFFLREAEVRLDLQRQIGGDGSLNNLLEGRGPFDETTSTDTESSD